MRTIFRFDAPADARRVDRLVRNQYWIGWTVVRLIIIAGALLAATIFAVGHFTVGIVVSLAVAVAVAVPIVVVARRSRAAQRWRVPVRLAPHCIRRAHETYRKLSPDSQQYARPLIETMYRLSVFDVTSIDGEIRIENEIYVRGRALDDLLAAEDAMNIAAAGSIVTDRDDVAAAKAYQDALNEVAQKVTVDL